LEAASVSRRMPIRKEVRYHIPRPIGDCPVEKEDGP